MLLDDEVINELAEFFGALYDRWQDEKEYEDFAEYRDAFNKSLDKRAATLVRMTASPFVVRFTCAGFLFNMKATAKEVIVGRVPLSK